ncbi:hypothetical protein JCM24511_07153 [Saitozyma sp. JCM 24511]|nr:hypothetical protein JCM24511_07153 [Saitozyma sp. JCM 24511]
MPTAFHATQSELYKAPPGHLLLQLASLRTAAFTCEADPRASFYLYIPSSHPISRKAQGEDTDGRGTKAFPLVVLAHGSGRDAEQLRNRWSDEAEKEGFVVLAPLFPCDMKFPDGTDNYKKISWQSASGVVRYDRLLLNMIDTVARDWKYVRTDKFSLAGYSGGGQFAHRFFYLHPDRVSCVSIGAPGNATPLRSGTWPSGITDAASIFGRPIDPKVLSRIPIQLVVGDEDKYHPIGTEGTPAPLSRLEVLLDLAKSYDQAGLEYELVVKTGVRHEEVKVMSDVQAFVSKHLRSTDGQSNGHHVFKPRGKADRLGVEDVCTGVSTMA